MVAVLVEVETGLERGHREDATDQAGVPAEEHAAEGGDEGEDVCAAVEEDGP